MRHIMKVIVSASFFLISMAGVASSAGFGDLIINEINWAGNGSSPDAEWVEIYNTTGNPVSLSGWALYETNTKTTSGDAVRSVVMPDDIGTLAGKSYFLIADEESLGPITIPAGTNYYISSFSNGLRNAGEQIILKDDNGSIIDIANLPYTAWFAGSSTPEKRSMERNDDLSGIPLDGTLAGSWSTCTLELGTPGLRNSSSPVPLPPAIFLLGSGLLGLGIFNRGSRNRFAYDKQGAAGPHR